MSLFIEWVIEHWKVFVVALMAVAIVVLNALWRHEVNAFRDYRTNAELVAEAQATHAAEVITQQEQITKETTDGWKAAVDYLHAHPQRVLSRYCSGTGVSNPANGTDGSSQGPVLTASGVEEDAAAAVLQLNQLQDWVAKQGAVK